MDQKRHSWRVGLIAAALLVSAGAGAARAGGDAAGPAAPKLLTSNSDVSVNYDALDSLSPDVGPIIIGDSVVLKPPHGVARYRPAMAERASLSPFVCPCARHLHLRHRAIHKSQAAKIAKIEPAAIGSGSMPSQGIPTKVASEPLAPPAPAVKATPAPAAASPKVATAPVAPPPPATVSPPAAKAPAVPVTPPAVSPPAATAWSTPGASAPVSAPAAPPAKAAPPNVSLPQILTPPPPPAAKVPEKAEPKVEEKVAVVPPPAPQPTATTKPVDITKPASEVAAIPAPVKPADIKPATSEPVIVSYAGGGSAVPDASIPVMKDISDKMAADSNLRVQLFSYASDPEKNVSRSRRLSLERAVAVRKLLIDNGLDSTRIEVRALGDQNNGGEPDRVDVVLSTRH